MPVSVKNQMAMRDYLLDIDEFNRPKVVDMLDIQPNKINSAITMIVRLLYLKKGVYADHPDLGIDIEARYKFAFEDELDILNHEISEQMTTYLPELTPINVRCEYQLKDRIKYVVILINIDEVTYELSYNTESNTIDGLESMG